MPVLLFLIFFHKLRHIKSIWAIVLSCLLSIIIIKVLEAKILGPELKHYFYILFTFFEYSFFAYFLSQNLRNKYAIKSLLAVSILFILFLFIYTIFIPFRRVDSITIGVETIAILGFSFYFLFEKTKSPELELISTDFRFWIIMGMVLYLAGSFFIYIFAEQVTLETWHKYRWLTWVFYILKALFFTIGILLLIIKPIKTKGPKIIPNLDMI